MAKRKLLPGIGAAFRSYGTGAAVAFLPSVRIKVKRAKKRAGHIAKHGKRSGEVKGALRSKGGKGWSGGFW